MKKKAFTLVELIVVIAILAILGTIGFISIQGYSKDARDTTRISDINSMKKVLELYKIEELYYPMPDESEIISYSGSSIWYQGTFGSDVLQKVKKISNIPLDPLTETEYTYSLLNSKDEYQIGAIMEGDIVKNNLLNTTYALEELNARAYVDGTYNGEIAKYKTGTLSCILALPSIISSDINESDPETKKLENIYTNNKLVVKNKRNLPNIYKKNNKYNTISGTGEILVKSENNEYEISCFSKISEINPTIFIENLQKAYSGTEISNEKNIDKILKIDTSNNIFVNEHISNILREKIVYNDGGTSGETGGTGINPGDSCDDLDPLTTNDTYNDLLVCEGYYSATASNDINACRDGKVDWTGYTSINCKDKGINDISEWIIDSNTDSIYLTNNNISDISIISNLTNLHYLSLGENNITNISTISSLINLRSLRLSNNNINDFSPIYGLMSLDSLGLGYSNLSDISFVSNFPNLVNLELDNNNITNISAISSLNNLEFLNLSNNNISDVSLISSFPGWGLDLSNNPIGNSLNLPYAVEMYIHGTNITDLAFLSGMTGYILSIDSELEPQLSTYNIVYDNVILN